MGRPAAVLHSDQPGGWTPHLRECPGLEGGGRPGDDCATGTAPSNRAGSDGQVGRGRPNSLPNFWRRLAGWRTESVEVKSDVTPGPGGPKALKR